MLRKSIILIVGLIFIACEKTDEPTIIQERYERNEVTVYTTTEGIVFEYRNFFSGKITSDTLLLDQTAEQINGILFWPPPYSISFTRK